MLSTVLVVLPVFALVFACRLGVLGPQATTKLNRFVVYLALPALLFDITAHARWTEIWQPGFIAAFEFGSLMVFASTLVLRLRTRPLADATLDGLNAGYGNTGFIGFPLAVATLGRDSLPPTLVATILTVCVLFAIAIVLIEIGLRTEANPWRLAAKVARPLSRNPLLVAPLAGAMLPALGTPVPDSLESFLKLLGGAASPCALVALGPFLAEPRRSPEVTHGTVLALTGMKLLLQPGLTFVFARYVVALSPAPTHTAVLLAALPTGTGPFMLAEFSRREADMTARVVLVSTIAPLFTVSAYLALLR